MLLSFLKKSHKKLQEKENIPPIKVIVTDANEISMLPFMEIIAQALRQTPLFIVGTQKEQSSENFLNSENKNFFDFLDSGLKILKKYQADVLIRIYQEKNNIRLNFQTENMYFKKVPPFLSLVDSLYLPISFFQQKDLPKEISTLIASTIVALNIKKDERYGIYLKNLVEILSKSAPKKNFDTDTIPHLLNFLAFNYMSANEAHFEKRDVKLALSLVHAAYQKKTSGLNSLLEGTLLTTLGQIYQCALTGKNANNYVLIQCAIESYKKAQKHFNRYVFPYDYARLSLVLSKLYFQFFKLSDDTQTLRDAIFQLREAEKIVTQTLFPEYWAKIQHELGLYLALLSTKSNNETIAKLAIQNFQNEQRFYSLENTPERWAEIEEEIAETYDHLGKHTLDTTHFEKAIEHYGNAFDVFAKLNQEQRCKEIELYVQRLEEELAQIEK